MQAANYWETLSAREAARAHVEKVKLAFFNKPEDLEVYVLERREQKKYYRL